MLPTHAKSARALCADVRRHAPRVGGCVHPLRSKGVQPYPSETCFCKCPHPTVTGCVHLSPPTPLLFIL